LRTDDKMNVEDAVELCHIKPATVRNWIKRGWLVADKDCNGRWQFTAGALLRAANIARAARLRLLRPVLQERIADVDEVAAAFKPAS
jgi:predicted site-specific integrase-resolvase